MPSIFKAIKILYLAQRLMFMKMTEEDYELFKIRYENRSKANLKLNAEALNQVFAFLEKNTNPSELNIFALTSSNDETFLEQQETFTFLCHFIDKATVNSSFDEDSAKKSLQSFNAALITGNDLQLYNAPQNQGMLEKLTNGHSIKAHWLTDLDLERSLSKMGLKAHVSIASFNKEDIGSKLHFLREKNRGNAQPYTLPLLLNRGSEGQSQGTHWLCAKITINPIENTVSYQIEDSLELTSKQKEDYKKIIESAICFSDPSQSAFPACSIKDDESLIIGHGAQEDGYSCGYRALHTLLQDQALKEKSPKGVGYANLSADTSDTLVDAIVKQQFEDFDITPAIYNVLSNEQKKLFTPPIARAPTSIRSNPIAIAAEATHGKKKKEPLTDFICEDVTQCVGAYQPSERSITFPQKTSQMLDAAQYTHLFTGLSTIEPLLKNPLNNFTLAECNSEALKGLSAFYSQSNAKLFNQLTLTIKLDDEDTIDNYVAQLSDAIVQISKSGLPHLSIKDPNNILTKKQIDRLIKSFSNKAVTPQITLPEKFQTLPLQRELDFLTEEGQKKFRSALVDETVKPTLKPKQTIRRRKKIDLRKALKIDVELQEGISEEVEFQSQAGSPVENKKYSDLKVLRTSDLETAVTDNDFEAFETLESAVNKKKLVECWHKIFGNITHGPLEIGHKPPSQKALAMMGSHAKTLGKQKVVLNNALNGITRDALEKIMAFNEQFSNGINLTQLPTGFILINDPDNPEKVALHYDSTLEKKDTIAPKLLIKPTSPVLSVATTDLLLSKENTDEKLVALWDKIKDSDTYSRVESETFRRYLPELLSLTQAQRDILYGLLPEESSVTHHESLLFIFKNIDKAKAAFLDPYDEDDGIDIEWLSKQFPKEEDREIYVTLAQGINHQTIKEPSLIAGLVNEALIDKLSPYKLSAPQLNGLLNLYDKYGVSGLTQVIEKLEDIKSQASLSEFSFILNHVAGYEALMKSNEIVDALKTIQGFSKGQRQWWDKLSAAHQPQDSNLCDLVDDFVNFSRKLKEQGLPDPFFELSDEDNFKSAGNLPTTLGRMLSLLTLCNPDDKQIQWQAMPRINLSPEGAIRALTDAQHSESPCGFVVPEMDINPKKNLHGYNTSSTLNMSLSNSAQSKEQLYRFIAHQKYRMPLPFYQEAFSQLESMRAKKKLPEAAINNLYKMLLASTTGDNFKHFVNPANAAEHWKNIIKNIDEINIPVPGANEQIKEGLIETLMDLPVPPPLPILNSLVSLISKPLKNVSTLGMFGLPAIKTKMESNQAVLTALAETYGNRVYQGMKFYSDDDYGKIFTTKIASKSVKELFKGSSRDIFEEHLSTSLLLQELGIGEELIPLISTFKLDSNNITALADKINEIKGTTEEEATEESEIAPQESFNQVLLTYGFNQLSNLSSNDELTSEKALSFINSLEETLTTLFEEYKAHFNSLNEKVMAGTNSKAEMIEWGTINLINTTKSIDFISLDDNLAPLINFSKKAINDLIELNFKDNFPERYFEKLKSKGTSSEVSITITNAAAFKDSVIRDELGKLLLQFENESSEHLIETINLLDSMLKKIDSLGEKKQVMALLSSQFVRESPLNDFNQMLNAMDKFGPSGFSFLAQAALEQQSTDENFPLIAHHFISKVLPEFRKGSHQLTEVEGTTFMANFLLSTGSKELNGALVVESKVALTNAYQALSDALKETSPNAQNIKEKLTALKEIAPSVATSDEVKKLREELTAYNEAPKVKTIEKEAPNLPNKKPRFLGRLFNFMAPTKKTEEKLTEEVNIPDSEIFNTSKLKALSLLFENKSKRLQSYDFYFNETLNAVDELINSYPTAKKSLLPLMDFCLNSSASDESKVYQAYQKLVLIKENFEALNNQDVVIGLCENFKGESSELSFDNLIDILKGNKVSQGKEKLDFKNYPALPVKIKSQILSITTSLLNNNKACTLDDIHYLTMQCADKTKGADIAASLEIIFNQAPFPEIATIKDWFQKAPRDTSETSFTELIKEEYERWNKAPVAREVVNGFNLDKAKDIAEKMQGVDYSEAQLEEIKKAVEAVKELSTTVLLAKIHAIKDNSEENHKDPTELIALMAELLYRTKGQPQEGTGDDRCWGKSFEINTTQYLALHAMFKSGGHVTSQIGTGEGKSRISMLAIASQWALGNTVDFVTADVSLATRDYLEYQAFFKSLGAETNLISATTPPAEYRIKGINFSDPSNLSLFRNKARSEGKDSLVIDPIESKRALIADEADNIFYDSSDTRFNYSALADPSIKDMPWVYELLVEFFMNEENQALYSGDTSDADLCNESFYNFARGKLEEQQLARLVFNEKNPKPLVSRNQLEAWQNSALTALSLQNNKDFVIKGDLMTQTKGGALKVSQAQLVTGARSSGNAKFSFGVHQCLHARLNIERAKALSKTSGLSDLETELKALSAPFHVDSENQIIYSSSAKALSDDYQTGELFAVTGTAGSLKEREEAKNLYGKQGNDMIFIDVPRHKGQARIDFPVSLAKTPQQHNLKIVKAIREGLKKNQPILLVCENDEKSEALLNFLKSEDGLTKAEQEKLCHINAKTSLKEESEHVKNTAGEVGTITVTTAMLGRGTDIGLHGKEAKTHGLNVIAIYLPRQRDYEQIIGRAGRFGANGQSQLIVEESDIKEMLGADVLPTEFYTATESLLSHLQETLDISAQKNRLINDTVGDFRLTLTTQFFEKFYHTIDNEKDKEAVLNPWRVFIDETDKAWNDIKPELAALLSSKETTPDEVQKLLTDYQEKLSDQWEIMQSKLKEQTKDSTEGFQKKVDACFKKDIGKLTLSPLAVNAIEKTKSTAPKKHKAMKADKWDPAHVGRAVIYTNFSARFKGFIENFKSAYKGETSWFPNYQAWKNGNMNISELLFGGSANTQAEPLPRQAENSALSPEITSQSESNKRNPSIGQRSYSRILFAHPEMKATEMKAKEHAQAEREDKERAQAEKTKIKSVAEPRLETIKEEEAKEGPAP